MIWVCANVALVSNNAINNENVFFIDGETIYKKSERDCCTVDGVHPNDLGFMSMANAVEPYLLRALKSK